MQVITFGDEVVGISRADLCRAWPAQKASPYRTLVAELANGSVGYIPNEAAYPPGIMKVPRCAFWVRRKASGDGAVVEGVHGEIIPLDGTMVTGPCMTSTARDRACFSFSWCLSPPTGRFPRPGGNAISYGVAYRSTDLHRERRLKTVAGLRHIQSHRSRRASS